MLCAPTNAAGEAAAEEVEPSQALFGSAEAVARLVPALKASTAAQFRKPTEALEASANGGRAALLTAGHVLMGGGVPLVADGCTVGGVGVSGVLPDQDSAVAAAGAAVL